MQTKREQIRCWATFSYLPPEGFYYTHRVVITSLSHSFITLGSTYATVI